MGCLALVNDIHYWPVIQRFLTWSTSAHLFPLCRIVPSRSVKTSGCIIIFRFTFDSPFSFCQWCRPPLYVAVSVQQHPICWLLSCVIVPCVPPLMIWYLEIQLLLWSDIHFQHYWSVWYMWYLDIDSDLYFRAMLRWFIVYFQFSYTCIHSGSILYFLYGYIFDWTWVCPPQTWADSLFSFIGF